MTEKVSVDLTGPPQTMLSTLYCKALDASLDRPILGDKFAKDAVSRIDYDWEQLRIRQRWTPLVTVRTAQFDIWASQFLAVHPSATVIHLGCGLDTRVFRLDPGPGVEWYDIDYPAVIALRQSLFPERSRYHLVSTSATDLSWLEQISAQRPVLLLIEGVSMYLEEREGIALLQRVVDRFPSGELQIDFYNRLTVRSQKSHRLQRRSGSTLYWAVNGPADILDQVLGLRLLTAVTFFDAATFDRTSAGFGLARSLVRAVPPLRKAFQYHRYAFGAVN